jgi:hypothetical protein
VNGQSSLRLASDQKNTKGQRVIGKIDLANCLVIKFSYD